MKKYQVRLEGQNFIMKMDGKETTLGFYTTRFVEASDKEEAELKAVEIVRRDSKMQSSVLNAPENPPMIYLDEICELDDFPDDIQNCGYTFFPEEGQNDI